MGLGRARLQTRARKTHGDIVLPQRRSKASNAQSGGSSLRLGGSLAAAVGDFLRAPTTRAAPPHGQSENRHIPPTAH